MLVEFHAKDFALFREIDLEFSPRLNVVTGETGSGKSLFLSAVEALCGEKPRFLNEKSVVEGRFVRGNTEEIVSVKYTSSRSSARLNGSLVSLATLKKFMQKKIAIHSQEAPAILKEPKNHMSFVDLFNPEIKYVLKEYKELYHEYKRISKEMDEISSVEALKEERELLKREIERFESTLVGEEEYANMLSRYKRLAGAKEIMQNVQEIVFLLEGENGVENLLSEVLRRTREIERTDEDFSPLLEKTEVLLNETYDLERDVKNYVANVEADENEMFILEKRLAEIESLKRRYGLDLNTMKEVYEEKISEIEGINRKIRTLNEAEKTVKNLKEKLLPLAQKISILRSKAAKELMKITERNLRDLGIKDASMEFVHKKTDLGENGIDFIEFMGSTNRGLSSLPLSKIASGGETARLYLALEAALGEKLPVETAIFDEVASAVGIRTADVVAGKLKELSEKTQLVVVTHMPQIAAIADRHFKVEKFVENGMTFSRIRQLTVSESKEEIREMFGKIPQEVRE